MKKYILAIVTVLTLTQNTFSQTNSNIEAALEDITGFELLLRTEEQLITDIEKSTAEIKNNIGSYKKIVKNGAMATSSVGFREIFLKEKDVQLITLNNTNVGGGQQRVEYYYAYGQLIYVEQTKTDFDVVSKKSIEKFYVNNGHLVAWFNSDNKLIDTSSADFKALDSELDAYAMSLKKESLK